VETDFEGLYCRWGEGKRVGKQEARWDTDLAQFDTHRDQRGQRTTMDGEGGRGGMGEHVCDETCGRQIVEATEVHGLHSPLYLYVGLSTRMASFVGLRSISKALASASWLPVVRHRLNFSAAA
jgi:hypothetical protein